MAPEVRMWILIEHTQIVVGKGVQKNNTQWKVSFFALKTQGSSDLLRPGPLFCITAVADACRHQVFMLRWSPVVLLVRKEDDNCPISA